MYDPFLEKQSQLEAIAEADDIYQVWSRSQLFFAARFTSFADSQPEEVRNFLWGYAEAGRMKYQRMVNLACLHMEFPSEKNN